MDGPVERAAHDVATRAYGEVPAGRQARAWTALAMRGGAHGFVFTRLSYRAAGGGEDVTVCLARNAPDAACPGLVAQRRAVRRSAPALAAPATVTAAFALAPVDAGETRWDVTAQGAVALTGGFAWTLSG